jgi:hypothetical protein
MARQGLTQRQRQRLWVVGLFVACSTIGIVVRLVQTRDFADIPAQLGIAAVIVVPVFLIALVIRTFLARVARRSKALARQYPAATVFVAFANPTWPRLLRQKTVSIGLVAVADDDGVSLTQGRRTSPVWSKRWGEIERIEGREIHGGRWPGEGIAIRTVSEDDSIEFRVSAPMKSGSRIAPANETEELIGRLNLLRSDCVSGVKK